MDAPGCWNEFSLVSSRGNLFQRGFLTGLIGRADVRPELQKIHEFSIAVNDVSDDFDRIAVSSEIRACSGLDDFAHAVARQLTCPLGEISPSDPVFAPTPGE